VRKPSDYYAEIRSIEQFARDASSDSAERIQLTELSKQLDSRLLRLRQDLIEDICEGRIKGDQVVTNILALLKDTRRDLQQIERNSADSTEPVRPSRRLARQAA
jgi:hypothetical protein